MKEKPSSQQDVPRAYQQGALVYDRTVKRFDLFARFGFNISGWRREAIAKLGLKPGDTAVDLGCGTGLNFPLLYRAVGAEGKIIGVDLSEEMLDQAQKRAADNGWKNIQFVCADAAQFKFPNKVNACLSTYALILVPDAGRAAANACQALLPGGRFAVLDMAWPRYFPLWWRHVLFFLRSYGVTANVLKRRPWESVQQEMTKYLTGVTQKQFWFGFFYLCSGTTPLG